MDYCYTMLFDVLIIALPVFIIVFYNINYHRWEEPEFADKYGTVLEGFKLTRAALFYPFFFMLRRGALALIARFVFNNIWLQLTVQFEFSVIQLVYLLHFKPFDGSFV